MPKPNPNQSSSNDEDSRNKRIMANLKDSITSKLGPTVDSSDLQQRLKAVFPDGFKTPSHPPYALMIRAAISELKEENGSTEEAISDFINSKFHDLPFAHPRILPLQLGKLCEDEELALAEDKRYMLIEDSSIVEEATIETKRYKDKKKKKKMMNKSNSGGETAREEEGLLAKCIPVTGIVMEFSPLSSDEAAGLVKNPCLWKDKKILEQKKQLRVYQRQGRRHNS